MGPGLIAGAQPGVGFVKQAGPGAEIGLYGPWEFLERNTVVHGLRLGASRAGGASGGFTPPHPLPSAGVSHRRTRCQARGFHTAAPPWDISRQMKEKAYG